MMSSVRVRLFTQRRVFGSLRFGSMWVVKWTFIKILIFGPTRTEPNSSRGGSFPISKLIFFIVCIREIENSGYACFSLRCFLTYCRVVTLTLVLFDIFRTGRWVTDRYDRWSKSWYYQLNYNVALSTYWKNCCASTCITIFSHLLLRFPVYVEETHKTTRMWYHWFSFHTKECTFWLPHVVLFVGLQL